MPIDITNIIVAESEELTYANQDGSVTVPAGEQETILSWEMPDTFIDPKFWLHAIGATDKSGVTYHLQHSNVPAYIAESPLGTPTDMFSFTEKMGEPLEFQDQNLVYRAENTTSNDVDIVARALVELD